MRELPTDELSSELLAVYRRLAERELRARERVFSEVPSWTVDTILGPAGIPVRAGTVRRWRRNGQIFAVRHNGRDYFPQFQFWDDGPSPLIEIVLRQIRPADGWDALFWFDCANVWLDDQSPLDLLDEAPLQVVEAASHANDEISD